MPSNPEPCPCGRAASLEECCGPYLSGDLHAPDPESLMRSRYTAFALGTTAALDYLVTTHHPDHRPPELREGLRASIAGVDGWEGLRVVHARTDGDAGVVEFVATYRIAEERMELRERSEFVRERGRWSYTRGRVK